MPHGWIYAARPVTYGLLSSNILLVLSNVIRAMATIARLPPDRALIRSYLLRIHLSFQATSMSVPRKLFFPVAVIRQIRILSALEYCDGVNPT
jgi:hypothetical protein